MKTTTRSILAGLVATAFFATPAAAQQKVKIGFISTFSGPGGVIGTDMRNSVELALDHRADLVGLPSELAQELPQAAGHLGQALGPEHEQRHHQDYDELAGADVEHGKTR